MSCSTRIQLQSDEEESGRKKSFSFFDESPLKPLGNGVPNALSETLLEHKKSDIANKLEALRKATAKIHLNQSFPQKEQPDETAEDAFPTQDGRQKRGGNKLRKRTVADCLKAYCEPLGKSPMYCTASSQVKTSASGFSHQFVNSKVNTDLMDSIKSDLNKSKKFFVSRSEDSDSQVISKYFNQSKFAKNKAPACSQSNKMCGINQQEPSVEKEDEENYDAYFEECEKTETSVSEDYTKSDSKL